jgi:hypothetical protein
MLKSKGSSISMESTADLLRFGQCVKECPSGEETQKVECKPTNYTSDPDYFKECIFYIGGVDKDLPLRYPTQTFAGKFCVPDIKKAVEQGNEVVIKFKEEFDKVLGNSGVDAYLSDIMAAKW